LNTGVLGAILKFLHIQYSKYFQKHQMTKRDLQLANRDDDHLKPVVAFIEVAVALPVFNTFTYRVPESLGPFIEIGKRVLVSFGQRRVTGCILGPSRDVDTKDIKFILDILDESPLFPASMIPFFRWIADYYKHPIGNVIKNALPGGLILNDFVLTAISEKGQMALQKGFLTPLEKEILEHLKSGSCGRQDLNKQLKQNIPAALIQSLERRGLITRTRELKAGKTKPKMENFVALGEAAWPVERISNAGKKIIDILNAEGEISVRKLKNLVPSASVWIRSLAHEGILTISRKRVYRDPFGEPISPDKALILTAEQEHAVNKVAGFLNKGFKTFLLQGVTGSGKTEVYMHLAAEARHNGHCVLVLVPEIALITQMERCFRARFGDRVAVLHSGLSAGERYDQWIRILHQEADIVIGARSAVFAPFEKIGIIIVDEEHDTSYKQEGNLRYNARDLAVVRAKLDGCIALLGSATPSLQSYYNVRRKKFVELNLPKRIEERPLPKIRVVDLRRSRDARGIRRFITPELQQAMRETLDRGEQILLFLNRRGFASFPICAACGQAIRCKHCDISLTLHRGANAYKCHYCGFSRPSSSPCSVCGSTRIKHLGLGTEKIEDAVKRLFPEANIARMDRDTTVRKGSMLKILKDLRAKTIDILVGTQMVAKGHDFPNITLVGIICADLSLSFPDFRAGERTFQLLAQVAGRAGRGAAPGRVILQTYNPEHFSIVAAKDQDFKSFYSQEMNFRKALGYPPISRMIQLKIWGKDKQQTENHAHAIGALCWALKSGRFSSYHHVEVMGPIEASLPRIARYYRWQILLKSFNTKALHDYTGRLLAENPASFNNRSVKVAIDVDPFFMM
jgi:primosomal protein N' (replication factor Y)